ncbi:MAG: adenylate kinase family protein, partial [Woeseiaceae bacterium]
LNVYFSPQEELDACVESGGELIQREDDREETIATRLDVYRSQTEPVIDYYRRSRQLKIIDADGTINEVYARLQTVLEIGQREIG